MRLKSFKFMLLFMFLLTASPIQAQYDINVKISESEMNKALGALIEARGLNFGNYIGNILNAWFVNVDADTIVRFP